MISISPGNNKYISLLQILMVNNILLFHLVDKVNWKRNKLEKFKIMDLVVMFL